jgi:hypothetical protein
MLMVIFGAGASYDSALESIAPAGGGVGVGYRPPLANQLFEDRETFLPIREHFQPLLPVIADIVGRGGLSVEQVLQRLQGEASAYPTRYQQLAAVRFYLQALITDIIETWYWPSGKGQRLPRQAAAHRATAHVALIDQIRRHRLKEPVCLVTFNYDTLIEKALAHFGQPTRTLSDYFTSDQFTLFKLHGSVNWVRRINLRISADSGEMANPWRVAAVLIERAGEWQGIDEYVQVADPTYPLCITGGLAAVPAIAIPVESKSLFECPPEHLSSLMKLLPSVTKILTIGWRATEEHFLSLLKQHVTSPVELAACAESQPRAEATLAQLSAYLRVKSQRVFDNGFRHLVVTREIDGIF